MRVSRKRLEALPVEEAELGGKASEEHDTEAEAMVPVLDDVTEHKAMEAYADEAKKDD